MSEFRWSSQFQFFGRFLKQWFITHWRSLLLLLIGVYLPLQAFVILALQIWAQDGGILWDEPILLAIHQTAQSQLEPSVRLLSQLGTIWGVFPITVGLSLVFLSARRWRSLIYLLLTVFGSGIINLSAKSVLHRVRPQLWDYPPLPDYAFPSGHAMASMAFVAALVVLTWGSRWCGLAVTGGSLFVVAIAWTRLYLGVHYPSDIAAGWLISIAWAIGMSLLVKPNLLPANTVEVKQLTPSGMSNQ
ncbi:phosphatase PAP2 family protein [Oculatella sp. LEGE 06141]|uniref:phosphatase PAP2 family protein n=1 Tax=Oculatella sp. LEGE 06141 TaxID=1828648 RepID=UPI0018826D6D|nr:phosphatase PAP2 family protein [Oculatella sp. LEGE 06141]MBE9182809.1 phosphatase PAP2 family protein [Oculatella sp. LEGE 06141]